MPLIKTPKMKKISSPKMSKSKGSLPNSPKVDLTKAGYLAS